MKRIVSILIVVCILCSAVSALAETGTADKYLTMLKKLNGLNISGMPHVLVFKYSILQLYEYSLMYDVAYAENDTVLKTGYGTMGSGIKDVVSSVNTVINIFSGYYDNWLAGKISDDEFNARLEVYIGAIVNAYN